MMKSYHHPAPERHAKSTREHSGRGLHRGMIACGASLCALILAACLGGGHQKVDPTTRISDPQQQVIKLTMVPSIRPIRVLNEIKHAAPGEGLVLRGDAPSALEVEARGTADLQGEAWLQGPEGRAATARLMFDEGGEVYKGRFVLDPSEMDSGEYDLQAQLRGSDGEPTKIVTAIQPVRLIVDICSSEELDDLQRGLDQYTTFFETNRDVVYPDYRLKLTEFAHRLQSVSTCVRRIRVSGHCDTRGSDELNDRLGLDRARSVASVLEDLLPGFATDVESLGARDPNPDGPGSKTWGKNRWAKLSIETREAPE